MTSYDMHFSNDEIFLNTILEFETNKQISSIQLSEKEISIIKLLVSNTPDSLLDIKTCILEIIKDGKIDASDIPQFLKIIKDVYTLFHTNNQINAENISYTVGSIIKYITHIILAMYGLNNPLLVNCCDALVNSSVEMIDLQSSLITKTCFFKLC